MKTKGSLMILGAVVMLLFMAGFTGSLPDQYQPLARENAQLTPTCLNRADIPDSEYHWLYVPAVPGELATSEYYGFLAGQLIIYGVVDASDCPLGGVWPTGYANACGLDATRDIVIELQNVYDEEILQAFYDTGVPPVLLKQLLRFESQFWPIRHGTYHFGLGHLTLIGASSALQWNPVLYGEVCLETFNGPCPGNYLGSFSSYDNVLAGELLGLMDASCEECEYKVDIAKAEASIPYIAEILMGYCRQTSQIVYNVTGKFSGYTVDYATIWKMTLLNYNAGPHCVYSALDSIYTPETGKLSWNQISQNVEGDGCINGVNYANSITAPYYSFTP
ncbi:MAG: hypothetical protein JW757_09615 [Anaerolineales bacterium]|nr:hypothetical protein [Anaerolineales bacterium]